MDETTSPQNWVDIISTAGPFVVALASLAFNYLQTKRIAKINYQKDIEIANIQQKSIILEESLRSKHVYLTRLEEIYSPILARTESLVQNYIGCICEENKPPASIVASLEHFVVDDYSNFSLEIRKTALAKAIIICHSVKNHRAYELAIKLDGQITQALALFDFTGKSSGAIHIDAIRKLQKEYQLSFVSIFYCIANDRG